MPINIEAIEYTLPDRVVSNQDIQNEHPDWEMGRVAERTGVLHRHIAAPEETAYDLGLKACKKLIDNNRSLGNAIDGLIFCTQSPDYIMPPNSALLHRDLELHDGVFAFDYNLACSGFVYGLAICHGLIATNQAKNILLVTADTYSKYINPADRSVRCIFGDGAAVTWVNAKKDSNSITDIQCSTFGKGFDKFIIPAGGHREPRSPTTSQVALKEHHNYRSREQIHMNGFEVLKFANEKVPSDIQSLLEKHKLTINDVDKFIFHQASKLALDSLTKKLKIPNEKHFTNINRVGNLVSASIPVAMKDAWEKGELKRGDRILLVSFGVGFSYATALIDF